MTLSYGQKANSWFPELQGLSVITPSTIRSTDILQISSSTKVRPMAPLRRFWFNAAPPPCRASYVNGVLTGIYADNSLSTTHSMTRRLLHNRSRSVPSGDCRAKVPPMVPDLSALRDAVPIIQ